MPSKSPAQRRLMLAAAHDPDFAERAGVPVSVAKDFVQADERRRKGIDALAKLYGPAGQRRRPV